MNTFRSWWRKAPAYQALDEPVGKQHTRYFEYCTFLTIGIAQLYSYNCLLAASDYFNQRLIGNGGLQNALQSSIVSVSTCTSLVAMVMLAKFQKNASYPYRLTTSLIMNFLAFLALAIFCLIWSSGGDGVYFIALLAITFTSAFSTSLSQNAVFSFINGYPAEEGVLYIQSVLTGQAVAGILPSIAQIVAVLTVEEGRKTTSSQSNSFAYFLISSIFSLLAMLMFIGVMKRSHMQRRETHEEPPTIPLLVLFRKLKVLIFTIFFCFA